MSEKDCENPELHCDLHACQLKPTVINPEIEKIFNDPRYTCTHCGRKTHKAENLCAPKPL